MARRSYVHFMFSVNGLDDVREMLKYAERKVQDLTPVFTDEVDTIMREFFKEVFATQGRAAGTRWKPLTEATIRFKNRTRFKKTLKMSGSSPSTPMVFSGMARESLTDDTDDTHLKILKRTYERSTLLPFMKFHQTGYTVERWGNTIFNTPKRVPARRWMPKTMPKRYVDRVAKAIAAYIADTSTTKVRNGVVNRFNRFRKL